jgi:hypothetical protein
VFFADCRVSRRQSLWRCYRPFHFQIDEAAIFAISRCFLLIAYCHDRRFFAAFRHAAHAFDTPFERRAPAADIAAASRRLVIYAEFADAPFAAEAKMLRALLLSLHAVRPALLALPKSRLR